MEKLSNIILIVLFPLCAYLVIAFLTFFNPHFMLHEIKKYNYYSIINDKLTDNLDKLDIDYSYKVSDFKSDIEKYVKSRYKNYYIGNKIESDYDTEGLYLKHVKFDYFFDDYQINKVTYVLFISVLILVVLTGTIFNKTKKYHNLSIILLGSSIVMAGMYGLNYVMFNINNDFIYNVILDSLHYILGVSIILFEISLFKMVKKYFVK